MTRTIYRRGPNGEVLRLSPEQIAGERAARSRAHRSDLPSPYHMDDISPFVSPITREEISSRSALREHERAHNVRQCGELRRPEDFDNTGRRPTVDTTSKAFDRAYHATMETLGVEE